MPRKKNAISGNKTEPARPAINTARCHGRMIVLGIADRYGVVRRNPQLGQRRRQAGRLVAAGRQYHHGAFVEDDLHFQAQSAPCFQDDIFVGLQVAMMECPTDSGATLRRRNSATRASEGSPASRRFVAVAGS